MTTPFLKFAEALMHAECGGGDPKLSKMDLDVRLERMIRSGKGIYGEDAIVRFRLTRPERFKISADQWIAMPKDTPIDVRLDPDGHLMDSTLIRPCRLEHLVTGHRAFTPIGENAVITLQNCKLLALPPKDKPDAGPPVITTTGFNPRYLPTYRVTDDCGTGGWAWQNNHLTLHSWHTEGLVWRLDARGEGAWKNWWVTRNGPGEWGFSDFDPGWGVSAFTHADEAATVMALADDHEFMLSRMNRSPLPSYMIADMSNKLETSIVWGQTINPGIVAFRTEDGVPGYVLNAIHNEDIPAAIHSADGIYRGWENVSAVIHVVADLYANVFSRYELFRADTVLRNEFPETWTACTGQVLTAAESLAIRLREANAAQDPGPAPK